MVVAAGNLTDGPLLEELQKHRLQDLRAELALHSDAAVIVRPEHVHLVLICKQAATGWKKIVPSDSKTRSQPTGDAGGEVGPARHLSDGLSLQLLHLFRLPVGGLISMAQLAHHFCSTLNILESRGRKPLVNKDGSTQRTAYRSVLTAHV